MKRFPTMFSALLGVALALSPLHRADAAKKKASATESDSTAKKPAVKKAPVDETTEAGSTAAKKAGASPQLNLPLPTKPDSERSAEADPAAKKAPEVAPRPPKSAPAPTAAKGEYAPNATVEPREIAEFSA